LWLILSQPSEPVYQGKPLSYWCDQYAANRYLETDKEPKKQAETAIRAIGTNAIPTLLRMLKARDSKLKLKLIELASKQHVINIEWKTATDRHYEASMAFMCLGPEAKFAVPGLIEILNECHSDPYNGAPGPRGSIIADIFSNIGPAAADAVPQLVRFTTDTNYIIRWSAVSALGEIHAKPDLAVPTLTKSLRDPVGVIRGKAAISLSAFGSDAKSAVPELIKTLADPYSDVRAVAATALKKIDPEAAAKAGVK
jgi:hypothetical protein